MSCKSLHEMTILLFSEKVRKLAQNLLSEDFRREISKVGSWWEFWYRPVKFMGK